jgi:hypothetical protein
MKYKNKYTDLKNRKQVGGKIDIDTVRKLFNPNNEIHNPIDNVIVSYNNGNTKLTDFFKEKYNGIIYIAYTVNNHNLFNNNDENFYREDKNSGNRIRSENCNYVVTYKHETKQDKEGKYIEIEETISGNVIYEDLEERFVLIQKTQDK